VHYLYPGAIFFVRLGISKGGRQGGRQSSSGRNDIVGGP